MSTAPSPFSATIPNFQVAWDSTSLGWYKECPRLYQYQMIEGWQPRSKGIHLAFGGWYASALERYAHHRAQGQSHDESVLAVVKWTMLETMTVDENGNRTPWDSGDEYKNRYTLIRSIIWNLDDYNAGPWRTVILANGKPAVELSFSFEAFSVAGEPIQLSGHMDKMVENIHAPGQAWVADDKTTKSQLDRNYFAQYTPHNQMSLYTIAGKVVSGLRVAGVLVRAAQIGVGFTRFATMPIPRPEAVLTEWLADTKRWIERAHGDALANHWPMNDKSCDKFGGCPFRSVCAVSPSHRKSWLKEGFVKRTWNPLQARGL